MKLFITTVLILSFTVLFSQGNFIATYYPSSSNTVADGGLKVKYLNHINPVIYTIELGTVINSGRFFSSPNFCFDVGMDTSSIPFSDSIIYGDTVSNILISETAQSNLIARSYGAFRASAIDAITLDTLAIIKSKGYENEIESNYIQGYSSHNPSEGSFSINTINYVTNNGVYDTIYNSLASGPSYFEYMLPIFDVNNEANTSLLPDFEADSLSSGFYEFGSSLGYSISFRILDSLSIDTTTNTPFTVNITTTLNSLACNGSAYATVMPNSGSYQYYWDSNLPVNDSTIDSLCTGLHTLDVISVSGDSIHQSFYIGNIPPDSTFTINITTALNSLACNGSAYATVMPNSGSYQYYWDSNLPVNDSTIDSLCTGLHTLDVISVSGDSIHQSFYIGNIPPDSTFTSSSIVVTENMYIDCYNSSTVNVNSSTGPFTYSWDGNLFNSNNVKNGLCSGSHNLRVANSVGDTLSLSTFNHTLSFISTASTLSSCLGKAEIHIDSTNLDVSNFQYSWSGSPFSSNNSVDSLCTGTHTLLIIDNFGDTLVQSFIIDVLRFNLSSYSNTDTCNSFASLMPEGDPFAFFPVIGPVRDSIYISWNQLPFELFSPENQSIDSLCEGIYSVRITGAVIGIDTMILPFAIANANNTYNNDNITVVDDSINYYLENCSIDYNSPIDSSNISNFEIINNNYAVYTVDLWQSGSLTQLSDTVLSYGDSSMLLKISITFYCYQKSNSNIINIIDVVTPTNTSTPTTPSTSIKEKIVNTISIYPNPTNNVLNIETGENLNFKIKIYDSRGQIVLQSNQKQIDVSLLAKGLYYLNYQSKNSFSTSKFIKK